MNRPIAEGPRGISDGIVQRRNPRATLFSRHESRSSLVLCPTATCAAGDGVPQGYCCQVLQFDAFHRAATIACRARRSRSPSSPPRCARVATNAQRAGNAPLETPGKLAGKNLQSADFRRRARCAFVTTYAQRSIGSARGEACHPESVSKESLFTWHGRLAHAFAAASRFCDATKSRWRGEMHGRGAHATTFQTRAQDDNNRSWNRYMRTEFGAARGMHVTAPISGGM
ncbi:MAG: hypothetical protein QOF78_4546 [Phycisphaerales bacterium]|nr:hypothetical protein [Phycisphaerales bacterium]